VVAVPRQRVKANWSFTCTSADGILSRDADDFGGQTPLTAPARPVTVPRSTCNVVGDATLEGKGRVTVTLLGR